MDSQQAGFSVADRSLRRDDLAHHEDGRVGYRVGAGVGIQLPHREHVLPDALCRAPNHALIEDELVHTEGSFPGDHVDAYLRKA